MRGEVLDPSTDKEGGFLWLPLSARHLLRRVDLLNEVVEEHMLIGTPEEAICFFLRELSLCKRL
jgi:hypothetical protein